MSVRHDKFLMAQSWRKPICAVMRLRLSKSHGANGLRHELFLRAQPWRMAHVLGLPVQVLCSGSPLAAFALAPDRKSQRPPGVEQSPRAGTNCRKACTDESRLFGSRWLPQTTCEGCAGSSGDLLPPRHPRLHHGSFLINQMPNRIG
jgi:hypothetical protein